MRQTNYKDHWVGMGLGVLVLWGILAVVLVVVMR